MVKNLMSNRKRVIMKSQDQDITSDPVSESSRSGLSEPRMIDESKVLEDVKTVKTEQVEEVKEVKEELKQVENKENDVSAENNEVTDKVTRVGKLEAQAGVSSYSNMTTLQHIRSEKGVEAQSQVINFNELEVVSDSEKLENILKSINKLDRHVVRTKNVITRGSHELELYEESFNDLEQKHIFEQSRKYFVNYEQNRLESASSVNNSIFEEDLDLLDKNKLLLSSLFGLAQLNSVSDLRTKNIEITLNEGTSNQLVVKREFALVNQDNKAIVRSSLEQLNHTELTGYTILTDDKSEDDKMVFNVSKDPRENPLTYADPNKMEGMSENDYSTQLKTLGLKGIESATNKRGVLQRIMGNLANNATDTSQLYLKIMQLEFLLGFEEQYKLANLQFVTNYPITTKIELLDQNDPVEKRQIEEFFHSFNGENVLMIYEHNDWPTDPKAILLMLMLNEYKHSFIKGYVPRRTLDATDITHWMSNVSFGQGHMYDRVIIATSRKAVYQNLINTLDMETLIKSKGILETLTRYIINTSPTKDCYSKAVNNFANLRLCYDLWEIDNECTPNVIRTRLPSILGIWVPAIKEIPLINLNSISSASLDILMKEKTGWLLSGLVDTIQDKIIREKIQTDEDDEVKNKYERSIMLNLQLVMSNSSTFVNYMVETAGITIYNSLKQHLSSSMAKILINCNWEKLIKIVNKPENQWSVLQYKQRYYQLYGSLSVLMNGHSYRLLTPDKRSIKTESIAQKKFEELIFQFENLKNKETQIKEIKTVVLMKPNYVVDIKKNKHRMLTTIADRDCNIIRPKMIYCNSEITNKTDTITNDNMMQNLIKSYQLEIDLQKDMTLQQMSNFLGFEGVLRELFKHMYAIELVGHRELNDIMNLTRNLRYVSGKPVSIICTLQGVEFGVNTEGLSDTKNKLIDIIGVNANAVTRETFSASDAKNNKDYIHVSQNIYVYNKLGEQMSKKDAGQYFVIKRREEKILEKSGLKSTGSLALSTISEKIKKLSETKSMSKDNEVKQVTETGLRKVISLSNTSNYKEYNKEDGKNKESAESKLMRNKMYEIREESIENTKSKGIPIRPEHLQKQFGYDSKLHQMVYLMQLENKSLRDMDFTYDELESDEKQTCLLRAWITGAYTLYNKTLTIKEMKKWYKVLDKENNDYNGDEVDQQTLSLLATSLNYTLHFYDIESKKLNSKGYGEMHLYMLTAIGHVRLTTCDNLADHPAYLTKLIAICHKNEEQLTRLYKKSREAFESKRKNAKSLFDSLTMKEGYYKYYLVESVEEYLGKNQLMSTLRFDQMELQKDKIKLSQEQIRINNGFAVLETIDYIGEHTKSIKLKKLSQSIF